MEQINAQLLQLQEEWAETLLVPYVRANPDAMLSQPYYLGLSQEYVNSDRRVMIVGQETRGFGSYADDWSAEKIQSWCVGYLRRQLWGVGQDTYNPSPFWQFFRLLEREGYAPCWNNVDKIHRPGGGRIARLSREQEWALCGVYGDEQVSLLRREIALCAPDAVVFITGPQYCYPMSLCLGVGEATLWQCRPSLQKPIVDITSTAALGCPTFWTYHPAFLNRRKILQQVVTQIAVAAKKDCVKRLSPFC